MLLVISEQLVILHAFDPVIIFTTEWLIDVVGISCVQSSLNFIGMSFTFSQYLSACTLVLLHHFNWKNMIDLNIMGWKTIVKEVWWEHHVVTGVPEFRVVLSIEKQYITCSNQTESWEYHHWTEKVNEKAWEVKGTISNSNKSWKYRSHLA